MKGSQTFRDLKDFLAVHKPDLVFLMETKMTACQMGKLKSRLRMKEVLCVPRVETVNGGFKGGLCMLWGETVQVSFLSSCFDFIDVVVTLADGYQFRLTGFYGEPSAYLRTRSWDLLRSIASQWDGPWLCCGDFNEILALHEKLGGNLRSQRLIDNFRGALEECGLFDFSYTGYEFTWDNRRVGDDNVKERIDRGFGNLALIQKWGGFLCHHLVSMSSDHCPVLIENEAPPSVDGDIRRIPRRFLFEEMWTREDECEGVIKASWERDLNVGIIARLGVVAAQLKSWEREKFGSINKKVKEFRKELDELQRLYPSVENINRRKEVEAGLDSLLEKEEVMWHQRSRVTWLKSGDRNTKFFHGFASQRSRSNRIAGVLGEDNRWRTGYLDVGCVFVDYFRQLFSTNGSEINTDIMAEVAGRVSESQARSLCRPFLREEIETALKGMRATKSPGPDGMSPIFYQKYWPIVGDAVVARCLQFLNGDGSVADINHTLIALIPKVTSPKKVTEYRPISLCNVVYKLISKALANRLKLILSTLIADVQSAFVPGRLIHDNVIAAFETVHNLKRRGRKSRQKAVIKLDMAKAYDRVEWGFLRSMMVAMGFPQRFVGLIMNCVQSVSYSLLIQGRPFGRIIPTRGIRQGDPISPYLFLLVAEGFTSLLRKAERERRIHGVAIARRAPVLTHLFFAHDSLLFCDASVHDCSQVKDIFTAYERCSGQKISVDKSAICFSPRTTSQVKEECSAVLDMKIVPCHERYLGLPMVTGKSKKKMFTGLADRVWQRVQGWEGKLLSKGGKEVLIKAVAQSIPTYTMSVFQLPKGICDDINKHLARFWWGKSGKKGIHWRKWDDLCVPKSVGGLGFREFESFNQALVAKLGWRLIQDEESLVSRMLKVKYFPNSSFLEADKGKYSSSVWSAIIWGKELLLKGLRWRVSDGASVRVFQDPWVPGIPDFRIAWKDGCDWNLRVAELITNSGGWDIASLEQICTVEELEAVLSIPITRAHCRDRLRWHYNRNGLFSVKSAYWVATNHRSNVDSVAAERWKHLWKLKVPPKIKHFLWRCVNGFIPCSWSLFQRYISDNASCSRCLAANETPLHAIWRCTQAVAVLERVSFYSKLNIGDEEDVMLFLNHCFQVLSVEEMQLLAIILWSNWNERNRVYHGENPRASEVVYEAALSMWKALHDIAAEERQLSSLCRTSSRRRMEKWSAPSPGMVKLNCDASILAGNSNVGLGAVLRNDAGDLLWAVGERRCCNLQPIAAEIAAIIVGLEEVQQRGGRLMGVESDCLGAVNMINGCGECLADEGGLVSRARFLMQEVGISCLTFIPRCANEVADKIAKFVARSEGRYSWLGVGPDWLMDVIDDDRPVTGSGRRGEYGEACSTTDISNAL